DRCTNRRQLKADVIEEQVWRIVTRLLTDKRWVAQMLAEKTRSQPKDQTAAIARLQRELRARRTEGDRLLRSYTRGQLDDARYARAMRDIRFEERSLEHQLVQLEAQFGRTRKTGAAIASLEQVAQRLKGRLSAMSIDEKAEVIALLNGKLTAHPER